MSPIALTAASALLVVWLLTWAHGIASNPRAVATRRHVSLGETIIVIIVLAALVALGIWFFFFAHGGIGLGSV